VNFGFPPPSAVFTLGPLGFFLGPVPRPATLRFRTTPCCSSRRQALLSGSPTLLRGACFAPTKHLSRPSPSVPPFFPGGNDFLFIFFFLLCNPLFAAPAFKLVSQMPLLGCVRLVLFLSGGRVWGVLWPATLIYFVLRQCWLIMDRPLPDFCDW